MSTQPKDITPKGDKPKKSYNVKPKPVHYEIARKVSENVSLKDAILSSGFSESVANRPQQVTRTKGFIQACNELGLTEQLLTSSLVDDIKRKGQEKKDRLGELTLGFKLHGKLKDTVEGNKTLVINLTGESTNRYKATRNEEGQEIDE